MRKLIILFCLCWNTGLQATTDTYCTHPAGLPLLPNPVLFVTQFPIAADFATIGSTFANHGAGMQDVGRGGDLYIRYPNGKLCNLTREGGFGMVGAQGTTSIAVRDPAINAAGTSALFAMVVGAPALYEQVSYYWQLYQITGLAENQPVNITLVANQPQNFNNIMPAWGSDGRIIFVGDRPGDGSRHLYPQHDEYESVATNTGLWSLNPDTGDLFLLQHSPSGSFNPTVDSYGRVIFTRWDHLQRDQQADADDVDGEPYGTFDFADETETAATTVNRMEFFPEPRSSRNDLLSGTNLEGHNINHFFPWMINQDGTGEETLNHIGRHELHSYFNRSINDDTNLFEFNDAGSGRVNSNSIFNLLQIKENPQSPGEYIGVVAPEFQTHASGQIVSIQGQPGLSADQMTVAYLTHPDTVLVVADEGEVPIDHSGHYRDPLPLSDGQIIVAHTSEARGADNEGSRTNPDPRYDFQLKLLATGDNGYQTAGAGLTGGISSNINYYDPDVLVNYDDYMWELNPVEVISRTAPTTTMEPPLATPEQAVFDAQSVDVQTFRDYMKQRNLALMVVRDITSRDDADRQQPFNLRAPGGDSTLGAPGKIYDVNHLQFFQADQVRGIGGINTPDAGRRVLARFLHDNEAVASNIPNPTGPEGSVAIADDGSAALFVPARRAMVWHSTDDAGTPVVRERYWINFQPGEIRICDGCHGVNELNQAGAAASENQALALELLLNHWKQIYNGGVSCSGVNAVVPANTLIETSVHCVGQSTALIEANVEIMNGGKLTIQSPSTAISGPFAVEQGSRLVIGND